MLEPAPITRKLTQKLMARPIVAARSSNAILKIQHLSLGMCECDSTYPFPVAPPTHFLWLHLPISCGCERPEFLNRERKSSPQLVKPALYSWGWTAHYMTRGGKRWLDPSGE